MKWLFFLLIVITTTNQLHASWALPIYNAQYLANRGILVDYKYNINAYRVSDAITRAEVVGIALKTAWIQLPDNYKCRGYFTDVRTNDWVCRAVEIAADGNFVSRTNPTFRHQSAVTRAEALAIIMQASSIATEKNTMNPFAFTDIPSTSWQYDLVWTAMMRGVVSEPDCPASNPDSWLDIRSCGWVVFGKFRPNEIATRADVFAFAKETHEYIEGSAGEKTVTPISSWTYKNYGYWYTSNHDFVYRNGIVIDGVDAASFALYEKDFIKDKNGVYKYNNSNQMAYQIPGINIAEVKIWSGEYIQDSQQVFVCNSYDTYPSGYKTEQYGCRYMENIDPATFRCADDGNGLRCQDAIYMYDYAGNGTLIIQQ